MRIDKDGIEATHDEILEWIDWHIAMCIKQKMPRPLAAQVGKVLTDFFALGAGYHAFITGAGIPCPKCQGRGHNNLILAGEGAPGACDNCEGRGIIYPQNKGDDETPSAPVTV